MKSWHLDRRTFLQGVGVTCFLAVPGGDGAGREAAAGTAKQPRRLACFVYFPNGCSLPEENDEANAHWRWFPSGAGRRTIEFTRVLESLEPYRDQIAIYGGLSHPKSRALLGHLAGDTWLTAGDLRGGHYRNNISVDQVAAQPPQAVHALSLLHPLDRRRRRLQVARLDALLRRERLADSLGAPPPSDLRALLRPGARAERPQERRRSIRARPEGGRPGARREQASSSSGSDSTTGTSWTSSSPP